MDLIENLLSKMRNLMKLYSKRKLRCQTSLSPFKEKEPTRNLCLDMSESTDVTQRHLFSVLEYTQDCDSTVFEKLRFISIFF